MPQPRRACAVRVTVVILSVCLTVRVNAHSRTTGYQGGRQQEVAKKYDNPISIYFFVLLRKLWFFMNTLGKEKRTNTHH